MAHTITSISSLIEDLNYPDNYKGLLTTYHQKIVDYVLNNYENTNAFKTKVVNCLNSLSYKVLNGEQVPAAVLDSDPLSPVYLIDDDVCREYLVGLSRRSGKSIYLNTSVIDWSELQESESTQISKQAYSDTVISDEKVWVPEDAQNDASQILTPKEQLWLKPPDVPLFDANQKIISATLYGKEYAIFKSLPEIPKYQRQISITTDVNSMSDQDILNLYPNWIVHTRHKSMYEECEGIQMHPVLGLLLPIQGFTCDQLIDNLIQYPHLDKLNREMDSEYKYELNLEPFWNYIEIDGELHRIEDVWDTLPESKLIPNKKPFIKEYVIRRYLLERDIHHIDHKFKLYGSLDPFLTLFMPSDEYIKAGYTNVVEIGRQCVRSRQNYKYTRNPILKRLRMEGLIE